MSVLGQLKSMVSTAEQDIHDIFAGGLTLNELTVIAAHVKADVAVAQGDLDAAVAQLVKLSPTVIADIQATLTMLQQLAPIVGLSLPELAPEIAAAQAVVAGLQALANAQASGAPSGQAVVAGVTAVQQAAGAKAAAVLKALNSIGVQ